MTVLQKFSSYIEDMDCETVSLVMHATMGEDTDAEFLGKFPRRLFAHLEDDLALGVYIIVTVTDTEPNIILETVVLTPEQIEDGKKATAELVQLLEALRFDADG